MWPRAPRRAGRRAARRAIGVALLGAAVGAACVDITAGPGGALSLRLDPVPPSIIVGDVLRDSLGNEAALRAVAFGENGAELADAPLRFTYVPLTGDTARRDDRALVVDSIRGTVRAAGLPFTSDSGRVGVRLGDRLQILDTLVIVPRPTAFARAPSDSESVRRLIFDCRDAVDLPLANTPLTGAPADSARVSGRIGNNTALGTLLRGDSAGTTVAVRRYLVRYEIVEPARATIPPVEPARGGTRPAIGLVDDATDTPIGFDTTNASGVAAPRLRIFPAGLTLARFPDSVITVRVRASARTSPRDTVGRPIEFVVGLRRLTRSTATGQPLACP